MDILSSLGNIGFDWKVALANLANFLIVFMLLKHFVFPPLQKTLDERKKRIQEGVENAQKAETSLLMAEKVYEEKVGEAHGKANEIIAEAEVKSSEIVSDAKGKATLEADKVIADARADIDEQQKAMEREVREKTADLVILGVEKVLKEEIDEEKNKKIIHSIVGNA